MQSIAERYGTKGKRIIVRYMNRKLYDVVRKGYISFEGLHALVRQEVSFEVIESVTGRDATSNTLASLMFHLSRRGHVFPSDSLLSLIKTVSQDAKAL